MISGRDARGPRCCAFPFEAKRGETKIGMLHCDSRLIDPCYSSLVVAPAVPTSHAIMRCVQLTGINQLSIADVPEPQPAEGEMLVRIRAAALNHRDVWIKSGQYAGLKWPCIPGSDGAGEVVAVGAGVDSSWRG